MVLVKFLIIIPSVIVGLPLFFGGDCPFFLPPSTRGLCRGLDPIVPEVDPPLADNPALWDGFPRRTRGNPYIGYLLIKHLVLQQTHDDTFNPKS